MITVPAGVIGTEFFAPANDATTGNRRQWFTYSLQDSEGAPKGALSGVISGSIDWHANAQVHSGGRITVVQSDPDDHDWLKLRVKITMHIEGLGDYPLGVFIPSAPTQNWVDEHMTLDIELLDKCSLLQEDCYAETKHVPAGANVTDTVRAIIVSAGEKAGSITDGTATLTKGMTWEPGTSKLQVINDLLDAANYFSLDVDGNGHFVVEKQRKAGTRPVRYWFYDNYRSIYESSFQYDRDIYNVPNKVIAIGKGDATTEALVATATNVNPNSPYSYPNRGRWVTDVAKGVDTTSQADLQEYADRRLAQLSAPQGTVQISHAPLPWLRPNDAVVFRRNPAELEMKAVISSMKIVLDPVGLQSTGLLEVIDL